MLNSTKTWQDEFEQECWGKFGSTKTINDIKQFILDLIAKIREETVWEAIRKIEKIKIAVAKQTGAYKYNSCYEDCIDILNKLKK